MMKFSCKFHYRWQTRHSHAFQYFFAKLIALTSIRMSNKKEETVAAIFHVFDELSDDIRNPEHLFTYQNVVNDARNFAIASTKPLPFIRK